MNITITDTSETTTYAVYKKYGVIANHDSVTEITEPTAVGTAVYLSEMFGEYENE